MKTFFKQGLDKLKAEFGDEEQVSLIDSEATSDLQTSRMGT
jgi:hypothetical protein